jgi:hypothetical protein
MKNPQPALERLLGSVHEGKNLSAVLTIHEEGKGAKQFSATHFPRPKKTAVEAVEPEPEA